LVIEGNRIPEKSSGLSLREEMSGRESLCCAHPVSGAVKVMINSKTAGSREAFILLK
jgi:hypothetical protein